MIGWVELLIIALICAFTVGVPIVVIVIVLLVVKRQNKQNQPGVREQLVPCPHCAKLIQVAARTCRFCGADPTSPPPAEAQDP